MASGGGRRLPADPLFPPVASDWKTGQVYSGPDLIYAEGKWWNRWHYERWKKFRQREVEKRERNKDIRRFLRGQRTDPGL